ncbi:MAG TPA: FUSC family protein [Candidatus Acidoferrales bacterium]|jgi:multidrug resistance protein MdtO|nr:FUSC family protein [Candidatus Acidoferrales bacterium]
MNTAAALPRMSFRPAWLLWLKRELAPFPGRWPMTVRMVVAVTLVTIISMSLQVPQLAFSAFFVFFVSKENRVLTLFTGVIMIAGATVSTALTLFLYDYTFDHPVLRVPLMAGFVFAAMFLSRTFVIGPLGFVLGFFNALMQIVGENAPNPDALVRGELWLWVALVYAIALTVVINQILLPADPWTALVGSLALRLNAAATALERAIKTGVAGGQTNQPLLDLATRGCTNMLGLLNFSEMKDPQLKRRHPFLVETIATTGHLVSATASFEFREPTPLSADDVACAKTLLADIAQLRSLLPGLSVSLTARAATPREAPLPQLREMQFAVESFRDSLIRGASDFSSTIPAKARKSLFNPDAFTNPSHVRFALKVTLAAMVCYLIYTGLHWPGISTAFITCCFVALGNTGATIYKSWLRLFGCLAGGLMGYLAIFFLIPHMESIASLVLLTAVASALIGWVAAGSERIAYAGLQAAFAFYLCVFQGFEPGIDLTIVRDRLVGILLGTVVSAIVFRSIWPEHAAEELRQTLSRVLREVSKLLLIPKPGVPGETDGAAATALHRALAKDLDSILVLLEQAAVENVMFRNPRSFSPVLLERLVAHIQALCLISTALLRKTKMEEWQRLPPSVQEREFALRDFISRYFQSSAGQIEAGLGLKALESGHELSEWSTATSNVTQNDRPRLVNRLIAQVQKLV